MCIGTTSVLRVVASSMPHKQPPNIIAITACEEANIATTSGGQNVSTRGKTSSLSTARVVTATALTTYMYLFRLHQGVWDKCAITCAILGGLLHFNVCARVTAAQRLTAINSRAARTNGIVEPTNKQGTKTFSSMGCMASLSCCVLQA